MTQLIHFLANDINFMPFKSISDLLKLNRAVHPELHVALMKLSNCCGDRDTILNSGRIMASEQLLGLPS